jgi:hypothetical protein
MNSKILKIENLIVERNKISRRGKQENQSKNKPLIVDKKVLLLKVTGKSILTKGYLLY